MTVFENSAGEFRFGFFPYNNLESFFILSHQPIRHIDQPTQLRRTH